MTTGQTRLGGIEVRSIDYVPLNERHGRIWHLGPLWFMSNAQIATLAVGLISISEGASLFWSVLAIVIGTLVGTLFMAFHSAQGPQLGLPQMIQSRPQFGYVGALLVWLFAYIQYAGFNVFNTILGADSMNTTAHGGTKPRSTGQLVGVWACQRERCPLTWENGSCLSFQHPVREDTL